MNDHVPLRIVQLRQLHPEIGVYSDELLLNAFCIDMLYGDAFAWTYLLKCCIPDEHVQTILRTATDNWEYEIEDLALAADNAMTAAGLFQQLAAAGVYASANEKILQ